jgi:hypothetical protein
MKVSSNVMRYVDNGQAILNAIDVVVGVLI